MVWEKLADELLDTLCEPVAEYDASGDVDILCEPVAEYDASADIDGLCEVLDDVDKEADSSADWDALADEVGEGPLKNFMDATRPVCIVDVKEVNCMVIEFLVDVQL